MTFSWEISIPLLLALVVQLALLVGNAVRTHDRSVRAEQLTEKADHRISELQTELAQFKEYAARRFVTDEMMVQLETRIVGAIDRLADRLDRLFEARKQ